MRNGYKLSSKEKKIRGRQRKKHKIICSPFIFSKKERKGYKFSSLFKNNEDKPSYEDKLSQKIRGRDTKPRQKIRG